METLTINVPDKKSALVKQLLKELGVTITDTVTTTTKKNRVPNALTAKTIKDAHNGLGLDTPIGNINDYVNSL